MSKKTNARKNKVPEDTKPDIPEIPAVKKRISRRLVMLVASGIALVMGVILFIVYIFNTNMLIGVPGVIFAVGGFFLFRYYWTKGGDVIVEQMGKPALKSANCLNIYRDRVVFEEMVKPKGYPQECKNDHKKYYVNIWDETINLLKPFILPDQQYYDPGVFAERVLELPAHRKIFQRREKLGQYIKTALLVVTIVVIWILIITTTGGG